MLPPSRPLTSVVSRPPLAIRFLKGLLLTILLIVLVAAVIAAAIYALGGPQATANHIADLI